MASDSDGPNLEPLAALAKLRLQPELRARLERDFAAILGMIEQMQTADTEGVEPLAHPLDLQQRRREDRVQQELAREELQRCAPELREGFYVVPRVVD